MVDGVHAARRTPTVEAALELLGDGRHARLRHPGDPRRRASWWSASPARSPRAASTSPPRAVKPKLSKLNPIKGAKRIFGPQALWEGAKMLLKSSVLGIFALHRREDDDAVDRRAGPDPGRDLDGRRHRARPDPQRRGRRPGDGRGRLRDAAPQGRQADPDDQARGQAGAQEHRGRPAASRARSGRASSPPPATG